MSGDLRKTERSRILISVLVEEVVGQAVWEFREESNAADHSVGVIAH